MIAMSVFTNIIHLGLYLVSVQALWPPKTGFQYVTKKMTHNNIKSADDTSPIL